MALSSPVSEAERVLSPVSEAARVLSKGDPERVVSFGGLSIVTQNASDECEECSPAASPRERGRLHSDAASFGTARTCTMPTPRSYVTGVSRNLMSREPTAASHVLREASECDCATESPASAAAPAPRSPGCGPLAMRVLASDGHAVLAPLPDDDELPALPPPPAPSAKFATPPAVCPSPLSVSFPTTAPGVPSRPIGLCQAGLNPAGCGPLTRHLFGMPLSGSPPSAVIPPSGISSPSLPCPSAPALDPQRPNPCNDVEPFTMPPSTAAYGGDSGSLMIGYHVSGASA
eukprot:TRINITY_DN15827_c0_g1_i3.p1 TRINITY_DN15827_c0_g1~~TRINITY_DN15827_c0_g1_i3.p1  ORF type:complete len:289 (+),score=36.61 TRINITY_DN15827_c0_g1_i3:94-960(+)